MSPKQDTFILLVPLVPAPGWRGHGLEDSLAELKPVVEMQNHE